MSLVILDIDRFKSINDTHGHPFGDAVLAAVGSALRSTLRRQGGLVARLGGDEFGLVLPSTDGKRASAIADAARAACASASPRGFEITCSAGIACFPDDAGNADAIIQLADGALYWAKESGRSRTRRYDAEYVMVVTDEQRAEFADLLTRPDCVRPVFQPIVCLRSGSIVGYEALARFEGKPGLPPAWWFRQAHRFGLGHRLEAEAIRAALRAGERPDDAFLSVNVSPSALESSEVQELLPDNLSGLVIEITEEERIGDAAAFEATLNDLRRRGARVAVDDAGAGYAGLQQVMRMKADVIKLDRALVADVHVDPAKVALIRALVQFGGSTGARICAEGIESLEELRALIPLGVDYAQGFRLARPAAPWAEIDPEARKVCAPPEGRGRVIALHQARHG